MILLKIAIGIALAATLLVLFLGLFSMARGGSFNARHGNRLMRLRVGLQLLAALLIAAAMALAAYDLLGG
ncbi:MAG: twin transmembrane helix small protein [Rhodospirillales bacterium]|nr:twin transmembrane helix small protein [Rhodospirillales bacterium]